MQTLEGFKVIDLATVVMGPFAARILGDMGADVVKVESLSGDSLRAIGPMRSPGMGPLFLNSNRNKRSIAIDLKSAAGKAVMHRLIEQSDVLIYNIRPQALRRLGFDYERCRAINPGIVHVGAFGFGQDGPYAAKPAYDDLIQGFTAIPTLIAKSGDGTPRYIPLAIVDRYVGAHVVNAVLGGLLHRLRTGAGQAIGVPMFETMVDTLLGDHFGGQMFDPPLGPAGYPRSLARERHPYRTQDGYVCVMMYLDHHWRSFGRIVGRDLLGTDPRFADITSRTAHAGAVHAILEEILATRTTGEWLQAFEAADIPANRLHTLDSLLHDPHLEAVDFFSWHEHPTEGRIRVMKPPSTSTLSPQTIRRHAPRLGEHTREVLGELGYRSTEIDALIATGCARQAREVEPPASGTD